MNRCGRENVIGQIRSPPFVATVKMREMQAQALNCPNCGAASSSEASKCQFCGSRLATVACPHCFSMMFIGNKHCPRCGAAAAVAERVEDEPRLCPRCRSEMSSVVIGATNLRQCLTCDGLWVDVGSFEKICADREQQSAVLGAASTIQHDASGKINKVRYVPCPECSQLMNRVNFARCSGVVVDVCKQHGTWFDRDELSSIVEFIHGGGLNSARAKERLEIAEERERLRQEKFALDARQSSISNLGLSDDHRASGIASARGLLKILLD